MLHIETMTVRNVEYVRTWSDEYYIEQEQTGLRYASAIDRADAGYTYVETDELLAELLDSDDLTTSDKEVRYAVLD